MAGFLNIDRSKSPVIDAIKAAGHGGIHNFALGLLTTYFRLETIETTWLNGALVLDGLPGSARRKVFIYDEHWGKQGPWIATLQAWQQTCVVYSIPKLPLPKESRFKETAYTLATVFDPASYPDARKRSKRLKQPFSRLERVGIAIRQLSEQDLPAVLELHNEWRDYKLSLPTTFKMMFPGKRYYNCVEIAVGRPKDYWTYGAFAPNGRLIGVRCFYIDGDWAFDLASFVDPRRTYSNFAEDFYIWALGNLHQNEVLHLNCGATLNKHLGAFKHHWPHFEVASWVYSKL